MTDTTALPEIGEVFQHGPYQVQVYAVDLSTNMVGIQYLNGVRSAVTLDHYREETQSKQPSNRATEATTMTTTMTTMKTATTWPASDSLPRYQALARCLDHIQRVRDQPRFEVALERSEERLERLMETAPSGSGFDAGTQIDTNRSTILVFTTAFHHMDSSGGYDGWTEHTIRVKPSLAWGFDLTVSGRDRNDIKDYIADTFAQWLNEEVRY